MNYQRGLHTYAVITAGATFVLLLFGALVTSNDAGLSVPDWPLSYGTINPPMVGGIVYEHSHRVVATFIGILTIGLAVWLARRETRRWVRRLGYIALALVIVQGLFGGATVLLGLPPAVSVIHATLAQTFFCLTVVIAVVTSRHWTDERAPLRSYVLPLATTAVLFMQLILGAILRHAGTIDGAKAVEFVFPAFVAHLVGAFLVAVMVVALGLQLANPNRSIVSMLPGFALFGLLVLQLLLGLASYLFRLQAAEGGQPGGIGMVFTASHLAVGALMLATAVFATLKESRLNADARRSSLDPFEDLNESRLPSI
jgi:heme a synthase